MKRYLGIFILTVMVGLSGCASDTDSDTQVSSRAYSMQIQQNQNRVQTVLKICHNIKGCNCLYIVAPLRMQRKPKRI